MIPQIKAILCVATLTLSFAAPTVDAAETPGLHMDGLTSLFAGKDGPDHLVVVNTGAGGPREIWCTAARFASMAFPGRSALVLADADLGAKPARIRFAVSPPAMEIAQEKTLTLPLDRPGYRLTLPFALGLCDIPDPS